MPARPAEGADDLEAPEESGLRRGAEVAAVTRTSLGRRARSLGDQYFSPEVP